MCPSFEFEVVIPNPPPTENPVEVPKLEPTLEMEVYEGWRECCLDLEVGGMFSGCNGEKDCSGERALRV